MDKIIEGKLWSSLNDDLYDKKKVKMLKNEKESWKFIFMCDIV